MTTFAQPLGPTGASAVPNPRETLGYSRGCGHTTATARAILEINPASVHEEGSAQTVALRPAQAPRHVHPEPSSHLTDITIRHKRGVRHDAVLWTGVWRTALNNRLNRTIWFIAIMRLPRFAPRLGHNAQLRVS
jgi:hypothetical protein